MRLPLAQLLRSDETFTKCLFYRLASTDSRTKPAYNRDKPHVNVCCLGDSGHGKTTLASAISLVQSKLNCATYKEIHDLDKSPEEVQTGRSIQSAKLELTTKSKHIVLTDLPGASDYMKNTIIGSSGADVGIIVVDGIEGPSSATRQHLVIARHSGINQLICFINKVDAADSDSLELSELATREMITEEGFNGDSVPFVKGSALNAINNDKSGLSSVENLIEILDTLLEPDRDLTSPGLFYVDRVYAPQGRGTGVTGIVSRGKFSRGQVIDCLGENQSFKTKINYIESFNKVLEETIDGDSVELILQGVKKSDIIRGMAIGPQGTYKEENHFEVLFQLLKTGPEHNKLPLITTSFGLLHYETGDAMAQIILKSDKKYMLPGQSELVEVKFCRTCVLFEGQSLLFRDGNRISGVGRVNKILNKMNTDEQTSLFRGRNKKQKEEFRLLQEETEKEING